MKNRIEHILLLCVASLALPAWGQDFCAPLYLRINAHTRETDFAYRNGREDFKRLQQLLKYPKTNGPSENAFIDSAFKPGKVEPILQYLGFHIPHPGQPANAVIQASLPILLKDYLKIPEKWATKLRRSGMEIHLTPDSIVEHPELGELRGTLSETGILYDDAAGVHDSHLNCIILSAKAVLDQGPHSSHLLHETGHAIEYQLEQDLGFEISSLPTFHYAFDLEKWDEAYYNTNANESFARAVDAYLHSDGSRTIFKKTKRYTYIFTNTVLSSTPEEAVHWANAQKEEAIRLYNLRNKDR